MVRNRFNENSGTLLTFALLSPPIFVLVFAQPENLLLDSRGGVKLSDFGWAVHAMPPHHHERLTMCGTPEYAAPEMLVFSPRYTNAVDVWSLGVLGYELLAGDSFFVLFKIAHALIATVVDCVRW